MSVMLVSLGANAQALKNAKNFLGGNQYEIIVGYNTHVASEPFSDAKIGYNLGLTARREVASFNENKMGVYGLVGLVLTKRGGKSDSDFMTLGDDKRNFSATALSLPIHAGAEYKWSKISLFADLGPNILFKIGSGEMENLSTNAVAFGGGFNMGIRFKRFGLSFGYDQDFTNLATFKPDDFQKTNLNLEKDSYGLKTGEFHFDLRWTFGKIKK